MSEPRRYSWEDYLYPPDADGVQILRNKPDLHDVSAWVSTERRLTWLRVQELIVQPELVDRTFDAAHWKAIHRQIFQDMYEWAGQFRTVNIGKDGHGFIPHRQLAGATDTLLGQLRGAGVLAGQDRAAVVEGLTYTLQGLNIIHPFREGNGRCQRVLTEHIAEHAGFVLDWQQISPAQQNRVMTLAYDGDTAPLHHALDSAITPLTDAGSTLGPGSASFPTPLGEIPLPAAYRAAQQEARPPAGGPAEHDTGPQQPGPSTRH